MAVLLVNVVYPRATGCPWSVQRNASPSGGRDSNICHMLFWIWSWQENSTKITNRSADVSCVGCAVCGSSF